MRKCIYIFNVRYIIITYYYYWNIYIKCDYNNILRCTQIEHTTLAASWSELGRVNLWNLNEQLKPVDNSASLFSYHKKCEKPDGGVKPLFTFNGHLTEGYGLDWCPTEKGTLASGDCKGNIHIWRISGSNSSASWQVDQRPYNSHAPYSVEDIQWSPNERNVLASCSVDKRFLVNYICYLKTSIRACS